VKFRWPNWLNPDHPAGPGPSDGIGGAGAGPRPRPARGPTGPDLVSRFGRTCPVCDATLGAAPPLDPKSSRFVVPPGFKLEVGPPDHQDRYPWRLTLVGGNYPRPTSTEPVFTEHEIDYVYLLCGGGHIFPDSTPLYSPDARQRIDEWNMVAALGAPASGKTYLLIRMLRQSLDNPDNWTSMEDLDRVRQFQLSPLEQIPLTDRSSMYSNMLATGDAIEPTMTNRRGTPDGILGEQLPDALDAIKEMIRRTVLDGERRARSWGTRFRQPLVLRTATRDRRTWTGVADLPGEMFDPDKLVRREQVKLRDYDSLIWVVDPAVAAGTLDRFARDSLADGSSYGDILDGSLRPGTVEGGNAEVVRANRDHIQTEIGQQLTLLEGVFTNQQGPSLQVLVAVSKCDLIHAGLTKKDLDELGQPGEVLRGVGGYLALAARRFTEGRLDSDGAAADLLHYLHGGISTEQAVRDQRVRQIAAELIRHFSDPTAFWNLAHTGGPDRIDVPGAGIACPGQTLAVPSIGEHLDRSLRPGAARRVLMRDLVMSAVGCGVAYGLGHEDALFKIIRDPALIVRFHLCSPLGTVPQAYDDGFAARMRPLAEQARFPRVQERSAALTQLLLSVLGKARA